MKSPVIPAKDWIAQLDEVEKDAVLILLLTARPNRMDEYFVYQGRKWIITPKGLLEFKGKRE